MISQAEEGGRSRKGMQIDRDPGARGQAERQTVATVCRTRDTTLKDHRLDQLCLPAGTIAETRSLTPPATEQEQIVRNCLVVNHLCKPCGLCFDACVSGGGTLISSHSQEASFRTPTEAASGIADLAIGAMSPQAADAAIRRFAGTSQER
jgi:hypothetical protein